MSWMQINPEKNFFIWLRLGSIWSRGTYLRKYRDYRTVIPDNSVNKKWKDKWKVEVINRTGRG